MKIENILNTWKSKHLNLKKGNITYQAKRPSVGVAIEFENNNQFSHYNGEKIKSQNSHWKIHNKWKIKNCKII